MTSAGFDAEVIGGDYERSQTNIAIPIGKPMQRTIVCTKSCKYLLIEQQTFSFRCSDQNCPFARQFFSDEIAIIYMVQTDVVVVEGNMGPPLGRHKAY